VRSDKSDHNRAFLSRSTANSDTCSSSVHQVSTNENELYQLLHDKGHLITAQRDSYVTVGYTIPDLNLDLNHS
jgi:hypothetical protein